ncbi:MAG: glycerol-3-phosphate ABC transporter ATP-binding protein, partial [Bacilli bacterium]
DVAENMGAEMVLYLSGIGNDIVTARVDSRSSLKMGATIKVALDMNKVHIFDKESEANVFVK